MRYNEYALINRRPRLYRSILLFHFRFLILDVLVIKMLKIFISGYWKWWNVEKSGLEKLAAYLDVCVRFASASKNLKLNILGTDRLIELKCRLEAIQKRSFLIISIEIDLRIEILWHFEYCVKYLWRFLVPHIFSYRASYLFIHEWTFKGEHHCSRLKIRCLFQDFSKEEKNSFMKFNRRRSLYNIQ